MRLLRENEIDLLGKNDVVLMGHCHKGRQGICRHDIDHVCPHGLSYVHMSPINMISIMFVLTKQVIFNDLCIESINFLHPYMYH